MSVKFLGFSQNSTKCWKILLACAAQFGLCTLAFVERLKSLLDLFDWRNTSHNHVEPTAASIAKANVMEVRMRVSIPDVCEISVASVT